MNENENKASFDHNENEADFKDKTGYIEEKDFQTAAVMDNQPYTNLLSSHLDLQQKSGMMNFEKNIR